MYALRRRFVHAHEISHEMLPWHRDLYVFLDDKTRIRGDINDRYERHANQAAIEILAQGDRLRREADDSPLSFGLIEVIAYRGSLTGKLMPPHLYCSRPFEERFRWQATGRAAVLIHQQLLLAKQGRPLEPLAEADVRGRLATLELESLCTPQAVFVLLRCLPIKKKLLSRADFF